MLLTIAASCTTLERCRKHYPCPEEISTETKIETVLKDSLIYLPGDTAVLRVQIGCDSLLNAYIKSVESIPGSKTKIKAKIEANQLTATCEVDSGAVYLKWKERHESKSEVKTKIVEREKQLTQLQAFWIVAGKVAMVILSILALIVIIYFLKNWL